MKLSIISKNPDEWHVKQVTKAALRRKVDVRVVDFKTTRELAKQVSMLGDVVFWRASSLDIRSERASLGVLLGDRHVINKTIFDTPYVAFKCYQQTTVSKLSGVNTIPTYRFRDASQVVLAIKKGTLKLPFIAKPNLGAHGFHVFLIRNETDLAQIPDFSLFVFQNFIPNTGDWRVIILGGRAIGVIRRSAQGKSHLNNIAKGAIGQTETRQKVLSEVIQIATKAAAALNLTFCGVDIIQDEETGQYFFLETNSALEWRGFQKATGIQVADHLIDHCLSLHARTSTDTPQLVAAYYKKNIRDANAKDFHFASRLYLWGHDPWARTILDEIKGNYLGKTKTATRKKLASYLALEVDSSSRIAERQKYYTKYDQLHRYNHILFKVLFAETIYGQDLRPLVKEIGIDEQMKTLFIKLKRDEDGVRVLSTRAINYFYLLAYYFGEDDGLDLDPEWLLKLAKEYKNPALNPDHELKLKIYLLTHAVIGASQFYNRAVREPVYRRMVMELETLIEAHYFTTSLDAKCEFLVCAGLVGYESRVAPIIHGEACQSLSDKGNFVVDTHNDSLGKKITDQLWQAEHRNILYLMSTMPFVKAKSLKRSITPSLDVIGRKAFVSIPQLRLEGLAARVDTGAFFSALHCTNIRERNGHLTFNLLDQQHPQYDHKPLRVSEFRKTPVKNTSGAYEDRYLLDLDIVVRGKPYRERFTLADRSHMMFPVLLGRTFLKKRFIVDPSQLTMAADESRMQDKETSK